MLYINLYIIKFSCYSTIKRVKIEILSMVTTVSSNHDWLFLGDVIEFEIIQYRRKVALLAFLNEYIF